MILWPKRDNSSMENPIELGGVLHFIVEDDSIKAFEISPPKEQFKEEYFSNP
jgi:hypothetical protein